MASTNTAFDEWDNVCGALVRHIERQDEKSLSECIKAIFGAIQFVAPYASTVYNFVKPMVTADPVILELNRINEKLLDLDKKLDNIFKDFKEELKLNEYSFYLNKLHTMQCLYTRYIQTPNTITLDALNKQSEGNEMFELINWLHREVTGQSLNSFIEFMKEGENYPKFIKCTQLILAHYAQAMLLHGISIQLRPNVSKIIIDQTLRSDTTLFEKKLREITNVFTTYIDYLKRNYFINIENKVASKLKTLPFSDGRGLANATYDCLSTEYPFREWAVLVRTRVDFMHPIVISPDFYCELNEPQTLLLIDFEIDGIRQTMNLTEHRRNYAEKMIGIGMWRYRNVSLLFVISTSINNCNYQEEVKTYLDAIDEKTYQSYGDTWIARFETSWPKQTAKVVLDGLQPQFASQIICRLVTMRDTGSNLWTYKYSNRSAIYFHKRQVTELFGFKTFHVEIITIKKD